MKKILLLSLLIFVLSSCGCDKACYDAKAAYEAQLIEIEKQRSAIRTQEMLDSMRAAQEAKKAQLELEKDPAYQEARRHEKEEQARKDQEELSRKQAADIEYMHTDVLYNNYWHHNTNDNMPISEFQRVGERWRQIEQDLIAFYKMKLSYDPEQILNDLKNAKI